MATREQLTQALVKAHAAGDVGAAKTFASELKRLAGPAPMAPEPGTARERFGMGLGATLMGPVQLAANTIDAVDPTGRYSAQPVNELVSEMGDLRRQANPPGFDGGDVAEFAGEALPYVASAPARAPAFVMGGGRARQAAQIGAAAGGATAALAPVEGDQYWAGKSAQIPAGVVGGAVLGPAFAGAGEAATRLFRRASNKLAGRGVTDQQVNVTINTILADRGIDPSKVGVSYLNKVRADVKRALETGGIVDEQAIANLGTLDAVGARQHATRGMVSQEPVQFGQELSLREVSPDLAGRFQGVRSELGRRLGDVQRAAPEVTTPAAGRAVLDRLTAADRSAKQAVGQLYDSAEKASGNTIFIKSSGWKAAADELRQKRAWDDLDPAAKRILSDMSRGKLTVRQAVEDIESLNARWTPGDPRTVGLGIVKKHLWNSIDDAATAAGPAYKAAMKAHRERKLQQEALPALEAASLGRAAPDDFMGRYVYNAPVSEVRALKDFLGKNGGDGAWNQVKGRVIADLREAATKGTDGKFLQDRYNAKLRELADSELLPLFFTAQEQALLKNVGRAGQLLEGPPGVSRTGLGGVARGLDMLGTMLSRYGGKWLGGPLAAGVNKVSTTVQAQAAKSLPPVATPGNVLSGNRRNALAAGGAMGGNALIPFFEQ